MSTIHPEKPAGVSPLDLLAPRRDRTAGLLDGPPFDQHLNFGAGAKTNALAPYENGGSSSTTSPPSTSRPESREQAPSGSEPLQTPQANAPAEEPSKARHDGANGDVPASSSDSPRADAAPPVAGGQEELRQENPDDAAGDAEDALVASLSSESPETPAENVVIAAALDGTDPTGDEEGDGLRGERQAGTKQGPRRSPESAATRNRAVDALQATGEAAGTDAAASPFSDQEVDPAVAAVDVESLEGEHPAESVLSAAAEAGKSKRGSPNPSVAKRAGAATGAAAQEAASLAARGDDGANESGEGPGDGADPKSPSAGSRRTQAAARRNVPATEPGARASVVHAASEAAEPPPADPSGASSAEATIASRTNPPPAARLSANPATAGPDGAAARLSKNFLAPESERGGGSPRLTESEQARFVQRVARAVAAARNQEGPILLRLSPPELGSLRLEVKVQGGILSARIEAETPQARNLLLENVATLRERLAEQNIRVDQFDVDLLGRSPHGSSDGAAGEPSSERDQGADAAGGDSRETAAGQDTAAAQRIAGNGLIDVVV
jgi:flagellar hook-length control protein FliK